MKALVLSALLMTATATAAAAEDVPEPADAALDQLPQGTAQAFHIQWGWGDRGGETIDALYQIQDARHGTMHVHATTFAGLTTTAVLDRQVQLTGADIAAIRAAAEANDFWNLTEKSGLHSFRDENGVENVMLCNAPMILTGFDQGRRHGVSACTSSKYNPRAWKFGHVLLEVAQRHVPDFAKNRNYWD